MLFSSYCHFESINDITPEILKSIHIDTLFLDIDNTIKKYGDNVLYFGVEDTLRRLDDANIKIILCSNNYKKNVEPFAKSIGYDFVHMCLKPSPFGYLRALKKTKSKRKNILVCGDQTFTDILGAKLCFLKSAQIRPIDTSNESNTVKFRRRLFKYSFEKNMRRKNPF